MPLGRAEMRYRTSRSDCTRGVNPTRIADPRRPDSFIDQVRFSPSVPGTARFNDPDPLRGGCLPRCGNLDEEMETIRRGSGHSPGRSIVWAFLIVSSEPQIESSNTSRAWAKGPAVRGSSSLTLRGCEIRCARGAVTSACNPHADHRHHKKRY